MMHTEMSGTQLPVVGGIVSSNQITSAGDGPAWFRVAKSVTAAEVIAGAVTLLSDSDVPYGLKVVPTNVVINFDGSTAFTTATDIRVSDTSGTPIDFVTVAIANTTGTKVVPVASAPTGVTVGTAMKNLNASGAAGKGLQLRTTGSTPAAGATLYLVIEGFVTTA